MAKLMTLFVVLIAIQASLLIFATDAPESTQIWNFFTDPSLWNTQQFVVTMLLIAGGVGLVGIAAGSVFGFKTDFLIFAPAIAGFISMGAIFMSLGGLMRDELIQRLFSSGCSVHSLTCAPANLITGIIIGPIAFYYVFTVVEWWRGKDY